MVIVALFAYSAEAAKPAKKPAKPANPAKQEQKAAPTGGPIKIEGFDTPESVVSDGRFFYVSNMGKELKPQAKDGDGYVSLLSPDGKILRKKLLPQNGFFNSPKGLIVAGAYLYVADVDMIYGYYLPTGKQMFKMDFSKESTTFLNAFAKKDDSTLFVSSTDTGKIFEVTIRGKTGYKLLIDGLKGPNGLKYDAAAKKLYVVGWGKDSQPNGEVGVVDLNGAAPVYKSVTTYKGYLDGVVLTSDGKKLVFSDWVRFEKMGWLRTCDVATGAISEVKLSEPIGGPADFFYDAATGKLWIPMMMEGKVLVEKPSGF
ncbi:MAG: hypothetical protein HZA04_10605 [Nitrospinae bacterium]|nr:hypothetical protein [Nitrospinota bacterium]